MPGPTSTDSNFERTFADLAYARLRDKAPSMLDYLIGFQLIDKNDDETHAVGVFGFKVGSEWVYAPVFFINGELKGHELMYIKSQDSFVPMVEEWVNYILNRRPPILGEGETTPRHRLPIRGPDFDVMALAPHTGSKFAAARDDRHSFQSICRRINSDILPFMHNFQVSPQSDEKFAALSTKFNLPNVLKLLGKQASYNLIKSMRNDEKFANAVLRFYDINEILKAAAEIDVNSRLDEATKAQRKDKETGPEVVVVTRGDDQSDLMKDMTEDEKKRLLKDQYIVRDKRDDQYKSRLYKSTFGKTLQTPTTNGLYEVVNGEGEKQQVLIMPNARNFSGNNQHICVVVDVEKKKFGTYENRDIMATKRYETGEYNKMFEKLPEPESLQIGDMAVLVGSSAQGTCIFDVEKKTTNSEGQVTFDIDRCYMEGKGGGGFTSGRQDSPGSMSRYPSPCPYDGANVNRMVLTNKEGGITQLGEKLTIVGSTVYVPKGFKVIKVSVKNTDRTGNQISVTDYQKKRDATIDLGNIGDAVMKMFKSAEAKKDGVHTLQLRTDGISFFPVVDGRNGTALSKLACLKHLIVRCGLGQQDAEYLLKEATPRKAELYFLKTADYMGSQPLQAYFPDPIPVNEPNIRAPIQYDMRSVQNLGRTDNSYTRSFYRDDRMIDDQSKQYAQQAADSGQKEILDTAVISGLVKTMDTDSTVDGFIGDLLLGLDRVGRILFMYYWHNDKFKDRYGQQDMIELEDNLRNVFKNLGELTLFLKQKTIEPDQANNSEPQLTDQVS